VMCQVLMHYGKCRDAAASCMCDSTDTSVTGRGWSGADAASSSRTRRDEIRQVLRHDGKCRNAAACVFGRG
jgi:hypothetical protein